MSARSTRNAALAGLVAAATIVLAQGSCSSGDDTTTVTATSSSSSGSGGAGGESATVSSTSSAGGDAGLSCEPFLSKDAKCAKCQRDHCCNEVAACEEVASCAKCLHKAGLEPGDACLKDPLAFGEYQCETDKCFSTCFDQPDPDCAAPSPSPSMGSCFAFSPDAGTGCNPITNEGCMAGYACSYSGPGVFACFPTDNQAACTLCDPHYAQCSPGFYCVGKCTKFCCDDGDCSASGYCAKLSGHSEGVCLAK